MRNVFQHVFLVDIGFIQIARIARLPGIFILLVLVSGCAAVDNSFASDTATPSPSPTLVPAAVVVLTTTPTLTTTPAALILTPTLPPTPLSVEYHDAEADSTLPPTAVEDMPTETPLPTSTPTPEPTPTLTPTPTLEPNLMGEIPVLMYHKITNTEGPWARTPDDFRADLETLLALGFFPVNLIDVVERNLDHVPAGRRPVVLTFDDSSAGQFWYLEDGELAPECALGILLAMHEVHGDDWPLRATFFVIPNEEPPDWLLFGQAEYAAEKLQTLIEWGMEVGSHTIHHPNLRVITPEEVQWELAVSQRRIEELIPGYHVRSLSLPEGGVPRDPSLVREGYAESVGLSYRYAAAVKVGSGPAPSPYSPEFDPFAIPRIRASQEGLARLFASVELEVGRYYVSDGGLAEAIDEQ